MANREFNRGQALQGMKDDDVHGAGSDAAVQVRRPQVDERLGRRARASVLLSQRQGGAFALAGIPPGIYTIEAWHEKLGAQTQMITIGPKESKKITFVFKV